MTWDTVVLEGAFQLRSRWTLICGAIMIALVVAGAFMSGGYVRSMTPVLVADRQARGTGFPAWLATSPNAAAYRDDLSSARPEAAPNLALTILAALGPMIAAVWGASVVGTEFARKTVRTRAVHTGWARSVRAKVGVIVTAAAAATIVVPIVGMAAGLVSWRLLVSRFPWMSIAPHAALPHLLPGMLAVMSGVAFYGVLGALIALVTKSLPAGIIGGLAFPYIESHLAKWWLPQSAFSSLLNRYFVYHPGAVVNAPPVLSQPPVWWAAWIVLLAWSALVAWALQKYAGFQEIT